MATLVKGFSKLTKDQKIDWLVANYFAEPEKATRILKQYWNADETLQKLHDEFVENTISNYHLPYSVVPNFLIGGDMYAVPMVTEESSVVAAAAKAATFWATRGGFKTGAYCAEKAGHLHFFYTGRYEALQDFVRVITPRLLESVESITANMKKRGGGVMEIRLRNQNALLKNYYQLHCSFNTGDAMGANFINTCLEKFTEVFKEEIDSYPEFTERERDIEVIMGILSNYTPYCLVRTEVSCSIADLDEGEEHPEVFAERFAKAIDIANVDVYRAVTHNKGIMNGIDAVLIATGNDYRSVEANLHAYAAKKDRYKSLSQVSIENDKFNFWMEIPMSVGTVGGLTQLHPLAKLSLEMLGNPVANKLSQIVAAVGLAQNFAAIRSLVTTGIQKGHMKMHLLNILNQFYTTPEERAHIIGHFTDKTITYSEVAEVLLDYRSKFGS